MRKMYFIVLKYEPNKNLKVCKCQLNNSKIKVKKCENSNTIKKKPIQIQVSNIVLNQFNTINKIEKTKPLMP